MINFFRIRSISQYRSALTSPPCWLSGGGGSLMDHYKGKGAIYLKSYWIRKFLKLWECVCTCACACARVSLQGLADPISYPWMDSKWAHWMSLSQHIQAGGQKVHSADNRGHLDHHIPWLTPRVRMFGGGKGTERWNREVWNFNGRQAESK